MSRTIKEMYERLSGINLLRLRLEQVTQEQRDMRHMLLDHERRLIRMEEREKVRQELPPPGK